MTASEIHEIKAGAWLGEITRPGKDGERVKVFELYSGITPRPTDTETHAFVAQEANRGIDEAVVIVREKGWQDVELAIEARDEDLLRHTEDMQGLIKMALQESGITVGIASAREAEDMPEGPVREVVGRLIGDLGLRSAA